jgi:hypothetical protein
MVDTVKIYERYFPDEITRQGFIGHTEKYMKDLLSNPASAKIDEYLEKYGLTTENLLKELLDNGIIKRDEKIISGNGGKDVFSVKYTIIGVGYRQKMRNLFIKLFQNHKVDNDMYLKESTTCGDATGGAFLTGPDGEQEGLNNQIQVPFMTTDKKGKKKTEIVKRKFEECKKRTIIITNKQKKYLEEVTSTMSVGGGVDGSVEGGNSYSYDAPAFVDAETADHKKIMTDKNLQKGIAAYGTV